MTEEWLTLTEAAAKLGVSERTLHRRITTNNYQTKTENGRKYVLLPDDGSKTAVDSQDDGTQNDVSDKNTIIRMQQEQLEMQQERINAQQGEIENLHKLLDDSLQDTRESKERSDTIIITLTQRVDEQVKMLEDIRKPQPLWNRVKARLGFQTAQPTGTIG